MFVYNFMIGILCLRYEDNKVFVTVDVCAADGRERGDAPFSNGARGLGRGGSVAVLAEELVELNAAGCDAVNLATVRFGAAARRHLRCCVDALR